MLIFLATLFATLCSIFRSRANLELENLALRHQIGVLQPSTRKTESNRSLLLGLAVPHLEGLARGARHRQTRNGLGLASRRFSPVLDWEGSARSTRTTSHFMGGPRPDPPDGSRESRWGASPIHGELLKLGHDRRKILRQRHTKSQCSLDRAADAGSATVRAGAQVPVIDRDSKFGNDVISAANDLGSTASAHCLSQSVAEWHC
jgi:hypothetical protein